jgi:hypothetical protein
MSEQTQRRIAFALEEQVAVQGEIRDALNQLLDAYRVATGSAPTGFNIEETNLTGGTTMAGKLSAGVNLTTLDDGKGVLYALTPVNAAGNPTKLPAGSGPVTGTSSSPAMTVAQDPGDPTATPPRPADTTGLVFLGSIAQPPVDTPGIVVTFTDQLTSGAVITTAAAPVDIIPDPNNPANPTGFTIVESDV